MSYTDIQIIEFIKTLRSTQDVVKIDMNTTLDTAKFDSLDIAIFFINLQELFGIPEELVQEFIKQPSITVSEIKNFIELEQTLFPEL